ncbi:MAG: LytTR family DNA-binding domain-containing protein [Rhodothermales bacterium]
MIKTILRALIVDPDAAAREQLAGLLATRPDVALAGTAQDVQEAVRCLTDEPFDVVFTEIMGLEVAERVGPRAMPPVIFCTAHDAFAIQAFAMHAVDYLLKPIDAHRFHEAMDRVVSRRGPGDLAAVQDRLKHLLDPAEHPSPSRAAAPTPLQRFLIQETDRMVFVSAEDVDWIEASGNYVVLHAGRERHVLRQTMKELEARLDGQRFLRIHRSTIVNVDRIAHMQPTYNGEYEVRLSSGKRLTLSRSYRHVLDRFL